jgi:serine/threonine protein kinase
MLVNKDEFIQLKKSNSPQNKKNITDFKIIRSLGRGSFGQVYMVKDDLKGNSPNRVGKFYAMKIISKTKIQTED